MATTLDDARIVVKIDTTQAEQAAEEMLKKRRGGKGAGGGSGGGGAPPGAGPSPGDQPNPQDGGSGLGAQTIGAGNVAGIPGLRTALAVGRSVIELEALQAVMSRFAGFFGTPISGDEMNTLIMTGQWPQAIKEFVSAGFHDLFEKSANLIGTAETAVREAMASLAAVREGADVLDAQAILTGEFDFGFAAGLVGIRGKLARADSQLSEARQKFQREMFGQASRDAAEKWRDDFFEMLNKAYLDG